MWLQRAQTAGPLSCSLVLIVPVCTADILLNISEIPCLRISSGYRSMLDPCARQTQTLPLSAFNLGQMSISRCSLQVPCPMEEANLRLCMCCPVAQKSPEGWAPIPTVVTCPWTNYLLSALPSLSHTSLPLLEITSQIRFSFWSWGLLLGTQYMTIWVYFFYSL